MPDPADKMHYVIGERMVFHSIGNFLRTDFFRAAAWQCSAPMPQLR